MKSNPFLMIGGENIHFRMYLFSGIEIFLKGGSHLKIQIVYKGRKYIDN